MDQNTADRIIAATHWPRMMAATALGVLALFLLSATISELKGLRFIGSGVAATNMISVTGEGEVFAVPDTATFSYSVMTTGKDVTTAQTEVNTKGNAIKSYLKSQGIDEKDFQTSDYSVNPHYEYGQTVCSSGYCPPGKPTLTGYDVNETVTVKVRDTNKAGTLLSGIGSKGATNLSGLSFTIADQDALDAQARDKAIAKAQAKADVLAKSLGVQIVRIVGFSEDGGGRPMYYAKTMAMDSMAAGAVPPAPEIATGQNKITSNVTISYEIR